MIFTFNEYALATYDGSKVRVWCDVRLLESGVFGEFEARGVVRLFISPGESGCVDIFVAVLLEDGRLIVRVLDYGHKRFREAWGQTRMDRTPTSVHVYNNSCWEPTTILCKIVVGFDPDDVCLYEWASGSTAIVRHERTLVLGRVLGVDRSGTIVTFNSSNHHLASFENLMHNWSMSELFLHPRRLMRHCATGHGAPPTAVDVVDFPHRVHVAHGRAVREFYMLTEKASAPKTYPTRIVGFRYGSVVADVGGRTILAKRMPASHDRDIALKYPAWDCPPDHAIPYEGLFAIDVALRPTPLAPAAWAPALHAWTTPEARAWVAAMVYACPLPPELVLGRVVPLVVRNPAHAYEEESDETSELFGGDMVPDFEGY